MLIWIYFNKQLFLLQALDGPKIASLDCHHPFWSLSCLELFFFPSSLFPTSKTFIFNFTSQTGSFHGFPFLHVPGLEVTNSKVIKIALMPIVHWTLQGRSLPAISSKTSFISHQQLRLCLVATFQVLHLLCCFAIVLTVLKGCAAVTEVVRYARQPLGV